MTDARREDYWETVEQDAQTVADLLVAESGDWTLHGVALAGREPSRDLLHLLAVRSRLGDSGLLLAVGYVSVETTSADVRWSGDQTCMMRVQGPITKALLQMIGRADAEGLAGEQSEPLLLDVHDRSDVQRDPSVLDSPMRDGSESSSGSAERIHEQSMAESEVRCGRCERVREQSQAENIGGGDLGDVWICSDLQDCEAHQ